MQSLLSSTLAAELSSVQRARCDVRPHGGTYSPCTGGVHLPGIPGRHIEERCIPTRIPGRHIREDYTHQGASFGHKTVVNIPTRVPLCASWPSFLPKNGGLSAPQGPSFLPKDGGLSAPQGPSLPGIYLPVYTLGIPTTLVYTTLRYT